MKQKISTLFVLTLWVALCHAQSIINSSGTTISDSNLVIEYSIGEIATTTLQNGQDAATQGLLQPTYQIISEVYEAFDQNFSFKAFPNPTADHLIIETDYPKFQTIQIFNLAGQKFAQQSFDGKPISLSGLPSGTYVIHFQSGQITKTIKIIKQ